MDGTLEILTGGGLMAQESELNNSSPGVTFNFNPDQYVLTT